MAEIKLDESQLHAGMRLGVAVSGGADSTALLRLLASRAQHLGLNLSVLHVDHGIRGEASRADARFVEELSGQLGVPFFLHTADIPTRAGQNAEGLELAAREERYSFFRSQMSQGLDAVATAHTKDDQAETVVLKLVRGAWTEGLGGISPVLYTECGQILRPLLDASRSEVVAYLESIGQGWREDETNQSLDYTRNRVRHELMPQLQAINPSVTGQLAALSAIARDEEAWWAEHIRTLASQLLLPGRAVRGGGRSAISGGLAIDVLRLAEQPPAIQRRLLRVAAERLGQPIGFAHTELLRALLKGRSGATLTLPGGLLAERSARELHLKLGVNPQAEPLPEYRCPVPGQVYAPAFGLVLRIKGDAVDGSACVRAWRSGDRVTLRYSRGPKRMKEVMERMKIPTEQRARWPVVELDGAILWMKGVQLEPRAGLEIDAEELKEAPLPANTPGVAE